MTTGVVRHACRHRVTARGVFGFEGGVVAVCFEGLLRGHVLAGGPASHACRRGSGSTRGFWFGGLFHTLGRDGTRGVGFCFFFGGCSGVGGGFFHTLGSDCTRELGLRGLIRCAGRPQEWSFGAVPPQSDGTRVKALWFFWRGILSHARERPHTAYRRWTGRTRGFDFLVWGILLRLFEGGCGKGG